MRPLGRRTHLWQKKGGQKKGMRAQFNHSYLAVGVSADHAQFAVVKLCLVVRIEAIVTGKFLRHSCLTIDLMGQCVWQQRDNLGCAHQRTGQTTDEQCGRSGRRFFMLGLGDPQDMAGILYQSMLKSASGADKGSSLFTRKLDRLERTLHTLVGTARGTPQGIAWLENGLPSFPCQRWRWQPSHGDSDSESIGGVLQGCICCPMKTRSGIVIADDPDLE